MHLLLKLQIATSILHQRVVRIETRNVNSILEPAENLHYVDIKNILDQISKFKWYVF